MSTKQVIVVRKDLNMRKGKIAAQVAHASMGAVLSAMRTTTIVGPSHTETIRTLSLMDSNPMSEWLDGQFTKVVVYVNSEEELLDLHMRASNKMSMTSVNYSCLITDSGKTEFNGVPTITCLAVGPDTAENVDRITGGLPLM